MHAIDNSFSFYKFFLSIVRLHRWYYSLIVVVDILFALWITTMPLFLGWIMNTLNGTFKIFNNEMIQLVIIIGSFFLISSMFTLFSFWYSRVLDVFFIPYLRTHVKVFIMETIFTYPLTFFYQVGPSQIAAKMNDLEEGVILLTKLLYDKILPLSIMFVFMIITVLQSDWKYAIILSSWTIFMIIVYLKIGSKAFIKSKEWGDLLSKGNEEIGSILENNRIILVGNTKDKEIARIKNLFIRMSQEESVVTKCFISVTLVQRISFVFLHTITISLIAAMIYLKRLPIGSIGVAWMINTTFVTRINDFVTAVGELPLRIERAQQACEVLRINDNLTTFAVEEKNVKEKKQYNFLENNVSKAGEIVIDSLSFFYDQNNRIFKDFSCKIDSGMHVGIVGKSGVGKSTLLYLLLGIYEKKDGLITINGFAPQSLLDERWKVIRASITTLLQEPTIFRGRTIRENIIYGSGRDEISMELFEEAVFNSHVDDLLQKCKNGVDTVIGIDDGMQLSGGEKQRIMLARAFYNDTPIFFLDEATSALDAVSEVYINRSIKKLRGKKTVLSINHNLQNVKDMDMIIAIGKNGFYEIGTHNSLLEKRGIYHELLDAEERD